MRLNISSHVRIERFLRAHFHDDALTFPQCRIYCGHGAMWITKILNIGAITIGRYILVSPKFLRIDELTGKLLMPGWLVAHEAVHVLQYERDGLCRFLVSYLREYFRTLVYSRRADAAARMAAYLSISHEVEARIAELAYASWSDNLSAEENAAVPRLTAHTSEK